MIVRKFFFALAALSLVGASSLVGCAADSTSADEEALDEQEGELTAAGKKLIGVYKDDSGAFRELVLTDQKVGQANVFYADVNTGIVCITAPCPSSERIEGTFTAGAKTITLKSSTASAHSQHLLGRYKYLVQGNKFSLTKGDFQQSLEKVVDQCDGLSEQACLAVPACQPVYGPRPCPPGRVCAADMVFTACEARGDKEPPPATACYSSATCTNGTHCSVEDGVCNSSGMLAVCSGTCVP